MNILIVSKYSKLEWEEKTLGLTRDELIKKYSKEKANLNAILKSHEKQLAVRNTFKSVFNNASFVMLEDANKQVLDLYDLVIVCGGDNALTKVSHYLHSTPLLGINSDPERSSGCLTRYKIKDDQDVYDLAEKLDFGEFNIEQWTRLEAMVDGKVITSATSEYFFGERLRKDMSRHILVYRGQEIEQKCSGLIVATGAGSTGWLRSSGHNMGIWKPTEKWFGFVATEPYNKTGFEYRELNEDEELKLYSLNDNDGMCSVDSWEEVPFSRGSEARIYLGEPLQVLVPNG